jgi:hypothetical protein
VHDNCSDDADILTFLALRHNKRVWNEIRKIRTKGDFLDYFLRLCLLELHPLSLLAMAKLPPATQRYERIRELLMSGSPLLVFS